MELIGLKLNDTPVVRTWHLLSLMLNVCPLSMFRIFLSWLKLSLGWLELELECIIEEREVYDCGAWSVFGVPGDEWYSYQHHFLY